MTNPVQLGPFWHGTNHVSHKIRSVCRKRGWSRRVVIVLLWQITIKPPFGGICFNFCYPPWKLTFSPLKMDGWKTFSFPFGFRPIFPSIEQANFPDFFLQATSGGFIKPTDPNFDTEVSARLQGVVFLTNIWKWMDLAKSSCLLGGGFKHFLFLSLLGFHDPIWRAYFSDGLKPPPRFRWTRTCPRFFWVYIFLIPYKFVAHERLPNGFMEASKSTMRFGKWAMKNTRLVV